MGLADIFEFTPDDLIANQHGETTERQRQRVSSQRASMTRGVKGMTLAYLLFFPGLMVVAVLVDNPSALLEPAMLCFIGGLVLLLLGLLGLSMAWTWLLHRDARRMRLHVVAGVAEVGSRTVRLGTRNYEFFELRLGAKLFRLRSAGELAAFQTGLAYRVYYVPVQPLDVILSVEVIKAAGD